MSPVPDTFKPVLLTLWLHSRALAPRPQPSGPCPPGAPDQLEGGREPETGHVTRAGPGGWEGAAGSLLQPGRGPAGSPQRTRMFGLCTSCSMCPCMWRPSRRPAAPALPGEWLVPLLLQHLLSSTMPAFRQWPHHPSPAPASSVRGLQGRCCRTLTQTPDLRTGQTAEQVNVHFV